MLNQELEEQRVFSARQTARIEQLELELTEMTNRLQSGAGSEAAQKRNERMKQMLERSSALYADLQTRYQKLSQDLEDEKQRNSKIGRPERMIILSDEECVTLNDDRTFTIGPILPQPKTVIVQDLRHRHTANKDPKLKDGGAAEALLKVYLRGVLLEFFIGDASAQHRLIPVILQLLECSPEQITAAQRGYAEGRQIIAKAASMLGL
jgi:hypothetical protein